MIKVCFINIYQETSLRGVETFVTKLSERLKKHFDVTVISGRRNPFSRWPILWRTFLDPHGMQIFIYTLLLLPKIWREKYDVIIPVNGGWMPAILRIVTWLNGTKMIISGQSGMGWDERNNLWCFPDCFIALSTVSQKWAAGVNPWVKSMVIPNGVVTNDFQPQGKKIVISLKSPVVLCVAALTSSKRIDLVIRAVSSLENFSLLLVGNPGESKDTLINMGRKLLGKRFIYKNYLHERMPEVYRSADVFTLVSESYFSFEIAIIEAMANGLPVVVNDDLIRREVVGDSGFYVNPNDTKSYAKALSSAFLRKTPLKNKLIERSKMFDWEIVAKKYHNLINELMS